MRLQMVVVCAAIALPACAGPRGASDSDGGLTDGSTIPTGGGPGNTASGESTVGESGQHSGEAGDDANSDTESIRFDLEPPADGGACNDGLCDACALAEEAQSSVGCEFWAVKTDINPGNWCFAAFVTNVSNTPAHLRVERDGTELPVADFARIPRGQGAGLSYDPYDANAGLPPGEVAILFLARTEAATTRNECPVPPAVTEQAGVEGTGIGRAFQIVTDQPVAAYQIQPYGGADSQVTSATLLYPVSTWGTEYIAVSANPGTPGASPGRAEPTLAVVATADNTEVTVAPNANIVAGGGVAAAAAGGSQTYTLSRGDYLQITQFDELTGSPFVATHPVGMFGGHQCMHVPDIDRGGPCDMAHQQIPPVQTLGHRYAGVRHKSRPREDGAPTEESPPWRLVGVVDGTQLLWTPAAPPGAPTTLSAGEVVQFASPGPWTVASQDEAHPFYLGSYMTGGKAFAGVGDPEWVNVVPTPQFLSEYVFFTDPTYPETHLVVVRSADDNGAFHDVDLACHGTLDGWTAIGELEYTRVDITVAGQGVDGCANGAQRMTSRAPFGVTVWGWGESTDVDRSTSWVSYGYPAGAGVAPINEVMLPVG